MTELTSNRRNFIRIGYQSEKKSTKVSTFLFIMGTATLALNQFRPFSLNVSLTNVCYLLSGVYVFIEWIQNKDSIKKYIPFHPFFVPACLILFGGILSSINAHNLLSNISVTLKEFFIFSIWMSVGVRLSRDGWTGKIINLLILGAVFSSLVSISDFIFGTHFGQLFVAHGSIAQFQEPLQLVFGINRYGGSMGHPNEQGMFLGVTFPLLVDSIIRSIDKHKSVVNIIFQLLLLSIIFTGALMAGSVTGYLGMAVSSLIVIFSRKNYKKALFIVYIVVLSSLIYIFLSNNNLAQTPDKLGVSLNQSRNLARAVEVTGPIRVQLMKEGIDYIISSPFIGAGMDQSGTGEINNNERVTSFYIHNTILQAWVAGGLFTFIGTLLVYFNSLKLAFNGIRVALKRSVSPYVVALSATTIGFFCMDMAQANIYQRFKWILVALLFGIYLQKEIHYKQ